MIVSKYGEPAVRTIALLTLFLRRQLKAVILALTNNAPTNIPTQALKVNI